MFKKYLKSACRQLFKNKLFSLINLVGLSVGLASLMALPVLLFRYLATYDCGRHRPDVLFENYGSFLLRDMLTTYPLLGEILWQCREGEFGTPVQAK